MKSRKVGILGVLVVVGIFLIGLPGLGGAQGVDCSTDSLQDAIDAAAPGDSISVTGTCNENILIPEGKDGIVLDGVTLDGPATIHGPNTTTQASVMVRARNVTIKRFSITGGFDGIWVVMGGMAKIDGNTIQGAARNGISVGTGATAVIINNTIQGNAEQGIAVTESASARIGVLTTYDTSTSPNIIQNNGENGIAVMRSSSALIIGNTINNNTADGVTVLRASHADIADNTINDNSQNGILVTMNSGANLGNDSGETIYDLPNLTTTPKNAKYGIKCTMGAYVDGRRGTLKGVKGQINTGGGCIDGTIP